MNLLILLSKAEPSLITKWFILFGVCWMCACLIAFFKSPEIRSTIESKEKPKIRTDVLWLIFWAVVLISTFLLFHFEILSAEDQFLNLR
jgi:hypothetical protein